LARPSEARTRLAPRRLLERVVVLAVVALLVTLLGARAAPAPVLDTLLAQVDSKTIAASDIALARALGIFGYEPTSAPIGRADIDRFVDILLILTEAGRIGLSVEPAQADQAWVAIAERAGGEAAFERWLGEHAIDRDWARRFVQDDLLRSKYFDERFAAFVFPEDDAITRELGPGQHDEIERERARQKLIRAAALKAQAEWLQGARRRASIKILLPDVSIAPPFPPP